VRAPRAALGGMILLLAGACANEPITESAKPAPSVIQTPTPRRWADACGAAEAQGLVGRPRSEIPVPVQPALQRVACTTCPMSEDVNPRRLNFLFDADTGLVAEVKCG